LDSGTGTIIAAAITGSILFVTQVATLIQVQKNKSRTEAFERSQTLANNKFLAEQRLLAAQSETNLAALKNELTKAFHLQTRWDPVRFEIYAEVMTRANSMWPIAEELAVLANRRRVLSRDREEGRIDQNTYDSAERTLSVEAKSFVSTWELGLVELEAARGRSDMIASPPVRDAVTEVVHALQATRDTKAGRGSPELYDCQTRFFGAKDDLRDAVRLELGSDQYASEQI
jgi:hypothetical protein